MIQGKLSCDANGFLRAEYPSPYQMLGWYLEQDVQSSIATCNELIAVCDEVTSGVKKKWTGTGNAHSVTITADNVIIENEFVEESKPCIVPMNDFRQTLRSWKDLLSNKNYVLPPGP